MQIHHIAITAREVPLVASFYETVLGLRRIREQSDSSGLRSVWLDLAGAILMIERADRTAAPVGSFHERPPGYYLLAFRIAKEERESYIAKFAEKRVPVVYSTDFTIYILDPERNRIGLSFYEMDLDGAR
ncbi:MAG TPA: VOC family protein [Leptospiraceae bacterium]|jgi:catechol 2,3-dioxygenase-like lactoylglutathione lyase family enzyme|nr:VOC family protein [Leptospirales bacterium]HMU83314.1 VOC family protein [Leptospiraceae bacterium]HMW60319.1 VOC family protein [Leptospiraceae bacterium]HMX55495.1 VOC family protein [Leptospiraceae bacterium]HMY47796.1 VOC family protein [Leptospiraceae bacterium]